MDGIDILDVLEGASTGLMLYGFYHGNPAPGEENLISILYLHWVSSFFYHIIQNDVFGSLDVLMIHQLISARLARVSPFGAAISHFLFLFRGHLHSISPQAHRLLNAILGMCAMMIGLKHLESLLSIILYLGSGCLACMSWFLAYHIDPLIVSNKHAHSRWIGILFHVFLAIPLYFEASFSSQNITTFSLLSDLTWLVFPFHLCQMINMPVKRLKSVISLSAALCLAPLSILSIYDLMITRDLSFGGSYTDRITLLYLGYTIIDIIQSCIFYPQYFGILDGWIHHVVSGFYAFLCWKYRQSNIFGIIMSVEIPTVLLQAQRVFPCPLTFYLRNTIFPPCFIFFRVIMTTFIIVLLWIMCADMLQLHISAYIPFTIMNLFWYSSMRSR